jgi:D-tyrosyl-tRNA(Tyr) deacylase
VRAVLQRVSRASVRVDGETVGAIEAGLLILLGVAGGDDLSDAERLASKTAELRIFSDDAGRFNLSLLDTGGSALVVSQFTLYADTRKGRRPGWSAAAPAPVAEPLVLAFVEALRQRGARVETGRFRTQMLVESVNVGPRTVILDL